MRSQTAKQIPPEVVAHCSRRVPRGRSHRAGPSLWNRVWRDGRTNPLPASRHARGEATASARATGESSAYYLLAFEATDVKGDGRFHPITVKVNRPGVQVRTRAGYYAEAITSARPAAAGASLEALSGALLPERGLPMSVATATFRGPSRTPVVLLTTGVRADAPAGGQPLAKQDGAPQFEPVEILTSAYRDGQKEVDWRQRLSIALPETDPGELRYESASTLALKPGTYELRVVSRHERTGVVGSLYTFVDVPDFGSEPLSVTGPMLFDSRAPTAMPRGTGRSPRHRADDAP